MLLSTIQNKIEKVHGSLSFDFDVRYLERWVRNYPNCFPKFILNGHYKTIIVWNKNGTDYKYKFINTAKS